VHREMLMLRVLQEMPERMGSMARAVLSRMNKEQLLVVSRESVLDRADVSAGARARGPSPSPPRCAAVLSPPFWMGRGEDGAGSSGVTARIWERACASPAAALSPCGNQRWAMPLPSRCARGGRGVWVPPQPPPPVCPPQVTLADLVRNELSVMRSPKVQGMLLGQAVLAREALMITGASAPLPAT
jgi:hypothetical protein